MVCRDNGDTLQILCFPGEDYVQHYAAIIATYLALEGRSPDVVSYCLPSLDAQMQPLLYSNLAQMGPIDIAVLGYVHGLDRFTKSGLWQEGSSSNSSSNNSSNVVESNDINKSGGSHTNDKHNSNIFAWQTMHTARGLRVAFLGCRVSFWGDIAGNVVRALQRANSVRCVLYVGKLGSLRAELAPNRWLATGGASALHGRRVAWANVLAPFVARALAANGHSSGGSSASVLHNARHCTLASVLDETHAWLAAHGPHFDLVDPEIGHMARAALERRTRFGYLHIVSDNLARKYPHDLSNERRAAVLRDRRRLVSSIQDVLDLFFAEWTPEKEEEV
jgi:hypothetical protein